MPPKVNVAKLKDQLQEQLAKEKHKDALLTYAQIEAAEPAEARWPHRKGDLQLRLKFQKEAVESYAKAVDLYVKQGFVTRGAALAKVVFGLDPSRRDVLERVDGSAVRDLRGAHAEASPAAPANAPLASRVGPAVTANAPSTAVPLSSGFRPSGESEPLTSSFVANPVSGPVSSGFVPLPVPHDDEPGQRRSFVFDAPLLELDPTAPEGEVRFVDSPDAAPMIFEEDDIVIDVDDDEDEVLMVDDDALPDLDKLIDMASIPLFADIPHEALTRMLELSDLVDLGDGGRLITRGADADALFILAEGRAEVVLSGGATIALSEGEIVGETCLFPGMQRGADVVARGHLRALSLDRHALEVLVNKWPDIASVLYDLLTRRLVQNLLRHSEMFSAFDLPTRLEVGRMFEVRRASPGTTLMLMGKRADGIYVPLLGTLEGTFEDGHKAPVATGTMLGEQSVLGHLPAKATVSCISEAVVLRLPAASFGDLASRFPSVLTHLAELSSRGSFEDLGRGDLHVTV